MSSDVGQGQEHEQGGGISAHLRNVKRASLDAGHNLKEAMISVKQGVVEKVGDVKHVAEQFTETAKEKYHEMAGSISAGKQYSDVSKEVHEAGQKAKGAAEAGVHATPTATHAAHDTAAQCAKKQ